MRQLAALRGLSRIEGVDYEESYVLGTLVDLVSLVSMIEITPMDVWTTLLLVWCSV